MARWETALGWFGLIASVGLGFMGATAVFLDLTVMRAAPVFGLLALPTAVALGIGSAWIVGEDARGYVAWVLAGVFGLGFALWLGQLGVPGTGIVAVGSAVYLGSGVRGIVARFGERS